MTLRRKRAHVVRAEQTRPHDCHWPGCGKQVPPAKWGCSLHWFKLPIMLRRKLWRAYVVGQEESLTPSREYIRVAEEIQTWIRNYMSSSQQEGGQAGANK